MRGRVAFLDVLRGIAILGILPVNAGFFAYAVEAGLTAQHPPGGGSTAPVALVTLFFELKFITLFSLLFGVGIGIQWLRADAGGRPFAGPMARRLVALGIFGALHATLLWYGDIVFVYALLGLLLCWFAHAAPGPLAWCGALLQLLPLALLGLVFLVALAAPDDLADAFASELPDGRGGELATASWGAFARGVWEIDPDLELAVYSQGSFARITLLRIATWTWALLTSLLLYGPRLAGLFLLGIAAARSTWALAPGTPRGRALHGRIAAGGLAAGLLLEVPATWVSLGADVSAAGRVLAEIVHQIGSLALAAGYASTVALVVSRAPGSVWLRPLAAVGRTAFSCYIGQSIVMTTLFYSYGCALFDRVSRWELWGIVLAVWAAQLVLAPLWLRFFRIGPLEWLWRTLTHLRPQPFLGRAR